jgi:hypothetical protein
MIRSLPELRDALPEMRPEQYIHHVNNQKNDFAAWIRDVWKDDQLAERARHCFARRELYQLLCETYPKVNKPSQRQSPQSSQMEKPRLAAVAGAGAQEVAQANAVALRSDPLPPHSDQTGLTPAQLEGDPTVTELQDDELFYQLKDQIAARHEALSEKYDRITKELQDATIVQLPKMLEEQTDALKTRYDDLQIRVSEGRKAGKDMMLPSLLLRRFPPRLQLARATQEPKDFKTAADGLDEAEHELEEQERSTPMDVRAEVLTMAGKQATISDRKNPLGSGTGTNAYKREISKEKTQDS